MVMPFLWKYLLINFIRNEISNTYNEKRYVKWGTKSWKNNHPYYFNLQTCSKSDLYLINVLNAKRDASGMSL